MNAREVVTQSLQFGCAAQRLNGVSTRRFGSSAIRFVFSRYLRTGPY